MKLPLTLLAFALSASAYGQTVGIDGKTMFTAPYWQGTNSVDPTKLAFCQFGGGQRSLLIDGEKYFNGSNKYAPPVKPEEITITLWTKDGKKWKAKWEEVK